MIRKAARKFWAAFHSGKYDRRLLVVGAVEILALVLAAVLASSAVSGCEAVTGQPSGEQDSTCSDCNTTVVNAADSKGNGAGADTKSSYQNPYPAGQHCGDCTKNSDCAEGLQCDTSIYYDDRGKYFPLFVCKTNEEVLTSSHVCETDCALTLGCWNNGFCHSKDGECVATSDTDCAQSVMCGYSGLCHSKDGECVAASDADCAQSMECEYSGLCHPKYEKCVAGSDADCAQSIKCRVLGECHQTFGIICQPTSDADCAQSDHCHEYGKCHLIITPGSRWCGPTSDADCAQSGHCRDWGQCHFDGKWCGPTSD